MVVGADVAGDVVMNHAAAPTRHAPAHSALQGGPRSPIGQLVPPLGGGDGRQISNRHSQGGRGSPRPRPGHLTPVAEADEEESRPVLRDAVVERVEDSGINPVAELAQRLVQADQHGAVAPRWQVGHVLDQDRAGLQVLDHNHEAAPELRPRILEGPGAVSDEAAEFRLSRPREWLTRRTAGDEIHLGDSPSLQVLEEVLGLGQIPVVAEAPKVGRVGLHRARIRVRTDKHRETCVLKAEAQAASPTEEIDGGWACRAADPASDRGGIGGIRGIGMRRQTQGLAAMVRDSCPPRRCTRGRGGVAHDRAARRDITAKLPANLPARSSLPRSLREARVAPSASPTPVHARERRAITLLIAPLRDGPGPNGEAVRSPGFQIQPASALSAVLESQRGTVAVFVAKSRQRAPPFNSARISRSIAATSSRSADLHSSSKLACN